MKFPDQRHYAYKLSPAAALTLVAGCCLTVLLFGGHAAFDWTGVVVAGSFTLLIAVYLQLVANHTRYAAEIIAASKAELAFSQQLLEVDNAARDFSVQALQLRDRAIELSADAISIYDAGAPEFPLSYVNPAFERMTGYNSTEILGMPCCVLHGEHHATPSLPLLKALLDGKRAGNVVLRNQKKDGTWFWSEMHIAPVQNAEGVIAHFVASQTDVTALRSYQEQLEHKAHYDALTGLANRVLLRERLSVALQFADRSERPVWVLFLGLDRFKVINETSGHATGDAVLKTVATRLSGCAGRADTVSRFGGDEFVMILQDPPDEKAVVQLVEKIGAATTQPIMLEGANFFVGFSIGIAVYPTDGADADALIMHADSAMHGAKSKGMSSFQFYTPLLNQRALERARVEADLRVALEKKQFVLHYQPQVDLRVGCVVGMEALIRWQHPERGQVPPAEFIGIAEETGLIVDIGAWVIRTACAQAKAWQQKGFHDLRMSVNLSARQFADESLVSSIASVLKATGLAPQYFQLELTETLVMADVERGIGILRDLKTLGVSIAVDDFGTGYSSLSYLKRLPIDTLKIDRSFVNDIALGDDDAVIVSSIISLAHSLRLFVVAEGVETNEQLSFLQVNGCDEIQGYLFSRPVSQADFTMLLEQEKSLPPYALSTPKPLPRLVRA